jgi:hypothetical protein
MPPAIISKLTRNQLRLIFPNDERAVRAFEKVLILLSENPTSLPATVKSNEVLLWLSM